MLYNFIYAQAKNLFLEKLNAGKIREDAIVFIEDTKEIWNRGTFFATPISEDEISNIIQDFVQDYI
jgi:hypothetical protein